MVFEKGSVLCLKSTGELCIVLEEMKGVDRIIIRRPVMSHDNGISHSTDTVLSFELETIEEHLRREAKEMVLKIKIQEEMAEAMEAGKKSRTEKSMVN